MFKANKLKEDAYYHFINYKDFKILYSENGEILKKENAPTLVEYTKEMHIPIYKSIQNINEFEIINEDYLCAEKGKQEYEMFKKIFQHYFEKSEN